jgi:hypothetical protein
MPVGMLTKASAYATSAPARTILSGWRAGTDGQQKFNSVTSASVTKNKFQIKELFLIPRWGMQA